MKLNKLKIIILLFILVSASVGMAKPRIVIGGNPYSMSPDVVVLQRIILNANNVSAYFQNTGIFDQNTTSGNTAGLEWPKGSGRTASFTAGLSIGCGINGQYAQVMASYKGEYAPGHFKSDGTWETTGDFKMYVVRLGDNASSNPDYANWYKMIPYGAPYTDVNKNKQYDDGVDIPGMTNAGQTIFECMGDGDVSQRSPGEGFGGGITTPILGAEIHFTAWAYTTPGLEDLQFINWVVINRGASKWDSTFTGVVVDPDLGDANDDYIGCDVTKNLAFCYNADNNDGTGAPPTYGAAPPAFGMDYFKSPIYKDPASPRFGDTLGLTSFVFFTNTGSSPPPCESDPNGEPVPAYHMLQGLKKDRSPFLDPTVSPPAITRFCYPGDPESGSGWTEYKGSVQNCNGITGTTVTVNPSGDRRFIFNSGGLDFVVNPGDTQNIVLAQFVQRGADNKNSVTLLKRMSNTAQIIYDNNFNVTPPPPPPAVNTSFTPLVNGLCNITLSWGDASESYNYWDTIFYMPSDSNIYKFEGYEVYEINKFSNQLPDFTKPYSIDPNVIKLVDAFDVKNNIGLVVDTFSTGTVINNSEVLAPFPIVPPFNMTTPAGFPQKGVSRSITLTGTKFSQNYGGQTAFIYGQEYQFAVVAYAVSSSTKLKRGFKVIRNSVGTAVIKVTPTAPPAGSVFTYKNGDTLNTNLKDLGLVPIIRNANLLQDATYRVQFNSDTTYNLMRKLTTGATKFDTLRKNLPVTAIRTTSDLESRTIDGVFLNTQKIRFSGAPPNYVGNVGILKDPTATLTPDSIQSRTYGWEWSNPGNAFLTGSKYKRDASRPWQSVSQSISYPVAGTFTNLRSALTADKLRKVTIQWTAAGQGQKAYYYQDTSLVNDNNYIFKGLVDVPFKVFVDTVIVEDATIPSFRVERRQVNCGFVESADSINGPRTFTGGWNPSADTLGGKLLLYTFATSYDLTITTPYTNRNLFLQQSQFDIMFVWSPRLVTGKSANPGEEFYMYPYTATRPFYNGTAPLYYEFTTKKPAFGDMTSAKGEMDKIKIVPNPYYGFSTLDRSSSDKFVTFTHLPLNCNIKIYTLNGDLIKTIAKTGTGDPTFNSTAEWDLQNQDNVPVASGVYIALIDAPGIGTKVLKLAVFTSQERINF